MLPRQPAAARSCRQVQHPLGAPRLSPALSRVEHAGGHQCALVRHQEQELGDEYRDAVFATQPSIQDLNGLRQFTEKFAADHKIALPFAIDPQGKLQAAVKADYALGQRLLGIEHTPTIWVVTANSKGAPFVEVVDRSKLFQLIDQALEIQRALSLEPLTNKKIGLGKETFS